MKNQNSTKLTRAYIAIAILIIGLFFCVQSCNNSDEALSKSEATREEAHKNSIERINALVENSNSKDEAIKTLQGKSNVLQSENEKLKAEKSILTNSVKKSQELAKSYNNAQIAQFYIQRYNVPNDVKRVEHGTQLSDSVAKLSIVDLIGGDGAIKELELTYKELVNTQGVVLLKDSIIENYQGKEGNFNMMLAEKDKMLQQDQNLIDQQQKSLRRKMIGNTFWKTTAIATGTYILIGLIKK